MSEAVRAPRPGFALPLIEARKVTWIRRGVPTTLVHDINPIGESEFVAITGPSGSGKSSLLYLLGLLDMPTSGEVLIRGRAVAEMDEEERAATRLGTLGFVFQFHFLLPEFTVRDNVILPMRALGELAAAEMASVVPRRSSIHSASRSMPISARNSLGVSGSGWRWHGRSPMIHRLSLRMSRPVCSI